MGHFYLTNKLLPYLRANKTRIVNVSSAAHREGLAPGNIMKKFVDQETYKGPDPEIIKYERMGFIYYGISKLSNVLFTRQLNKLYHKDGITALCLHPGVINTELSRNIDGMIPFLIMFSQYWAISKSIPQGAATTLRCVTISDKEIYNGNMDDIDNMALYFDDCRPQNYRLNKDFRDGKNKEIDDKLWDYSCKVVQGLDYLELNQ